MTNEEMFQDLKQFIRATVSQQMADVVTKDDIDNLQVELKRNIKELDEKIDVVQDAIASSFTHATETTDVIVKDHEQRLGRLERQIA